MKKLMLMIVAMATMFGSFSVFADDDDCDKKGERCRQEEKMHHKKHHGDKKICPDRKDDKERRRPEFTKEQREEMRKFFEVVKAYKADPTPENKAKVMECLNKGFDKHLEYSEKKLADLKAKVAELEKRNAELKANREAEIQKHFDKIMSFKKPERPKK
ncbi:MAG: hypothetical protein IJW31_09230 [Lentisphaeria bacterium]|nr:hypothetical protein [Lentisphaeria bacterium]